MSLRHGLEYDPHRGLVIQHATTTHHGMFVCKASLPGEDREIKAQVDMTVVLTIQNIDEVRGDKQYCMILIC